MLTPENNLLEKLNFEELRQVRRRMIECILSTDMAFHPNRLGALKLRIETFDIKNGEGIERMIFANNPTKTYENQQVLLNMCVHLADISNPSKPASIYKVWVDLVFQEFFNQGDAEKEAGFQYSALCNREIDINVSQIGFIDYVVRPTFVTMYEFMPNIYPYLDNIETNYNIYHKLVKESEKSKKRRSVS
jgi:hypothetical protein